MQTVLARRWQICSSGFGAIVRARCSAGSPRAPCLAPPSLDPPCAAGAVEREPPAPNARWGSRGFATGAGGRGRAGKPKKSEKTDSEEHGVIAEVVRAVRKGDVEMVKVVCVALRVDDLKEVLRELGGPISGSRALLLERILCHVPGYKRAALDPREALGTGAGRRPVLATPRQLIPADAETLVLTSKNDPSDGERGAPTFALPAMEGKDLLTGEKLPKKSLQVSRANDAFYDAYESANIRAMSRVWGKAPHVKCCQPGRRFVIGYKEVMDSWKELFASQKDQWPSKISVTEIRVVTASDIAWVTCLETLDQGQGAEAAQVLSTNIFRAQQTGASKARTRWLLECRASSRLIPGL